MPEEIPTGLDRSTMRTRLEERFTADQVKQRQGGGGKMLDYIPGEVIIARLNAATDGCWDVRIKDITERPMGNQTLVMAQVALTIPGLGTREHIGVQAVSERGGEDLVKGAVTDAIKKAATLFGVGLHLYDDDTPAQPVNRAAPAPPRQQQAPRQPAVQAAATGDLVAGWSSFWPWARSQGLMDKTAVEQAIGRSMDGLSPAQVRDLLGKAGAPAGEPRPAPVTRYQPEIAMNGPVTGEEAALISFRERAESGIDWLALLDEAGSRDDYLAELAATATTIGQLNTVVSRAKQLERYTVRVIAAERVRRPELQARADRLTR